jgi:hypothetical protein
MPRFLKLLLLAALPWCVALPAQAAKPAPAAPAWQMIEPSEPVYAEDGTEFQPSCSGFPGTEAGKAFRFWARMGKSDKTVVYFEGGGACWDNLTCSFPIGTGLPAQFYVPAIPPGFDPSTIGGLFRADRADNPVRDWNIVYIPYCTGDIHTGSATRTYANGGNPLLPTGLSFTIEHRGYDNFRVVLDWMQKNVRKPKQILVTGVSAGGYGATANFPWIEEAFKTARVSLLADASQGVTTAAFDSGNPGRNSWNPQLAPWVFGEGTTAVPGNQLMRAVAEAYPRSKVAQFTTALDVVQVQFYGVMKQFYGPGGSCPNVAVDWNNQMLSALTADGADLPNFRYYLADGAYHTLLRDDNYYDEATNGVPFAAWLGQMLKNQGGTGGRGGQWFDIACPGCLMPLPCQ